MIAHGLSLEQMVELVRAGLAAASAESASPSASKTVEAARVRIMQAGRKALAARNP